MLDLEFDLSDVLRACTEGQAQRIRSAQESVEQAAKQGVAQSTARRRYQDRTSRLTLNAKGRLVSTDATGGVAEMAWPVPYASYVDAGTPAHTIRPKLGPGYVGPPRPGQTRRGRGPARDMLRFEIGGRVVFAREVRHPGTKPYAFAGEAVTVAERVIVREVEVGFAELERILSR